MKPIIYVISAMLVINSLMACNEAPASEPSKFEAIIVSGQVPKGDAEKGKTLFNERVMRSGTAGCVACHTLEAGVTIVGPSQVGLATAAQKSLTSPDYQGKATTLEGFLLESIVVPRAYITSGYPDVMYRDYGQVLTEEELADLVAYLLTLK